MHAEGRGLTETGDGFDPTDLSGHLDELYRHARALTRDAARAADLVQDTAIRALERRELYTGQAPLGPWLHRVLHNLFIDQSRRSAREILVEEVEADWQESHYTVDAEVVLERSERREALEDALVRLPHIYRSAVVLHDIEGWTVKRISEVQDVSLPAAKQRLRRGRMAVVEALNGSDARRAALAKVPMRCWDARRHVSEYMDGALDEATSQLLESHLGKCPTCPPLYAALVGVQDRMGELRDDDTVIPPELAERLRSGDFSCR